MRIRGQLSPVASMTGNLSSEASVDGGLTIPATVARKYTGDYSVIPNDNQQVLETEGLMLTENIVIEPVPSYYGRILWDGSVITVY